MKNVSYSIEDVRRLKGGFLKRRNSITEDQLAKVTKNLEYLHHRAFLLNYPSLTRKSFLESFDIDEFLTYEESDINKFVGDEYALFIATDEQVTDNTLKILEIAKETQSKLFENTGKETLERNIANYESEIDNCVSNIEGYMSNINDYRNSLGNLHKQVIGAEEKLALIGDDEVNNVLVDAIKEASTLANWQYIGTDNALTVEIFEATNTSTHQISNYSGHFFLSEEIICSYSNLTAEACMSKSFGRLLIGLSDNGGTSRIVCAKFVDNFASNQGIQHPHLSGDGICWGNTYGRSQTMLATYDYRGVLELVWSLMSTYSPNEPFRTLDRFIGRTREVYKRWAFSSPLLLNVQEDCDELRKKQAICVKERGFEDYLTNMRSMGEKYDGLRRLGGIAALSSLFTKMCDNGDKLASWFYSLSWDDKSFNKVHAYMKENDLLLTKEEIEEFTMLRLGYISHDGTSISPDRKCYLMFCMLYLHVHEDTEFFWAQTTNISSIGVNNSLFRFDENDMDEELMHDSISNVRIRATRKRRGRVMSAQNTYLSDTNMIMPLMEVPNEITD